MKNDIPGLTEEENKAIRSLNHLAKKFPKTLALFSWSGMLCVCKHHSDDDNDDSYEFPWRVVTTIPGIANDGGDPDLKYWED